jgi:GTP cyclohydrolase FolE2
VRVGIRGLRYPLTIRCASGNLPAVGIFEMAVASQLKEYPLVLALTVEAENFESIHNHSAFARISLFK